MSKGFFEKVAADKSQLGFDYQDLVCLEYLVGIKQGESVGLEVFDDVHHARIDGGKSLIQVKHSINDGAALTNRDIDLWNNSFSNDRYFFSGDLGYQDSDGGLIYMGRVQESFNSGGVLTFPVEIEKVIKEMPGITDCVVSGIKIGFLGTVVGISYIGDNVSREEILRYARKSLPKQHWPARIKKFSKFPVLGSGKIDKQKIY